MYRPPEWHYLSQQTREVAMPVKYTGAGAVEIRNQWERFIKGKSVDESIVRDVVLRSWERSRAAGVDIHAPRMQSVPAMRLPDILKKHGNLIKCARPIMEGLFAAPVAVTTNITLADASGVILYKLKARNTEFNSLMEIGKINNENTIGTSGTGTCIAEKAPVELFAAEHFALPFHKYFCHAAPIYNTRRELEGVLSIATLHQYANFLTEQLNETAANAISEQLRMYELLDEKEVLMEMLAEGVMVVDACGIIRSASRKAFAMLGLSEEPAGRHIWDILKKNTLVESVLTKRVSVRDQETVLEARAGKSPCVCVLSSTFLSFTGGVVLTFTEAKRMRAFANRVTGAKAVFTFDQIIGDSPQLKKVVEHAQRAAQSDVTTLILGENGTGKELFAQSIHNAGARAQGPFIVVNCGALPRDLVQSELFGYEGGAFTGAGKSGQPGKFELADGGTVFLDEIGEMPLEAQVSLLRLLQQKEVTRLGGSHTRKVNVRIIAATNRDLAKAVCSNGFREDLYYRLNVFPLIVPPLRERQGDIPLLALHFMRKKQCVLPQAPASISPEALDALTRYTWPGNVRELENVIERLMNLVSGREIAYADLPASFLPKKQAAVVESRQTPFHSGENQERDRIVRVLDKTGGNVRQAADLLNISRNTLYIKIKTMQIELSAFRSGGRASSASEKRGCHVLEQKELLDCLQEIRPEQLDLLQELLSRLTGKTVRG